MLNTGMRTTLILIAGAAIAGWLLYDNLVDSHPVLAAKVSVGSISEFVDERAKTRLPQTYLVTMPYDGRLEPISLREGDQVRKDGDPVARLVLPDIDLKVQAARRVVERLEAAVKESEDKTVEETAEQQAGLFVAAMAETVKAANERVKAGEKKDTVARSRYARVENLFGNEVATQEELELAELTLVESNVDYRQDQFVLNAVKAMLAATELIPEMVREYLVRKDLTSAVLEKQKLEAVVRLEQAHRDRSRAELFSPIDGVVLARHISNERHISAGTVLLEIGQLENLEVEADVLSQDVVDVKVDDSVELYGPVIGDRPARGVVTRVFPAGFTKVSSLGVEQQRVKVIVAIHHVDLTRLLEKQKLGVDYQVRVKIFTEHKENANLIARSAIFRGDDGQWRAYAVKDGRAELAKIKIGLENDDVVEVIDGLRQGDTVILAPESGLESGQRVDAKINPLTQSTRQAASQN